MAHFAQLDQNNLVVKVIVVNNDCCLDGNGLESEVVGVAFCQSLYGQDSNWKQTSYSRSFRKNFAGIGYQYDGQRNAFIPPKIYSSWVLDEATCTWVSPVPYPEDGNAYFWHESSLSWVAVGT